jgi:hypothetical protein
MAELRTAKDFQMRYTRITDWLRSTKPNVDMPVWLNPQAEAELIERLDRVETDCAKLKAQVKRLKAPLCPQQFTMTQIKSFASDAVAAANASPSMVQEMARAILYFAARASAGEVKDAHGS